MKKERLDVLMVQRNLAESREKAKALIMSGIVYVNGLSQVSPDHKYVQPFFLHYRSPYTEAAFPRRLPGAMPPVLSNALQTFSAAILRGCHLSTA